MRCLLALLLLTCTTPAWAQTYRWVDERGQVHYSQVPPRHGRFEVIGAPAPPAAAPNQDALNKSLQDAVNRAPLEREEAERKVRLEQERANQCQQARDGLAQIDSQPAQRLVKTNPDGTESRVSEDEYAARRAELERAVSDRCR